MPNLYRGMYQLSNDELLLKHSSDETKRPVEVECAEKYVGMRPPSPSASFPQFLHDYRFTSDLVREKVAELARKGSPPSCFIAEPLSGNAGGVELPYGYLKGVYQVVREAGGLCICDEVQVGYGRTGKHFWCFQGHDVIPDIITMAKAAGNGYPLGFVVTSKAIIDEFGAQEGSFFSSAGGSPVSCVIGSTVLDVIDQDRLQANADEVGKYLNCKLKALQQKYPNIVGYIHGHGLYQGVELIDGFDDKTPATAKAYAICERLLELGVICHNTGKP
jgi:4-aminobutyrate aminotransferase-like enzyme